MTVIDILNSPWAITPSKLTEITEIYMARANGKSLDLKAVEDRLGRPLNNAPSRYQVIDGVAVLPLEGVIAKRMNLFTSISGGVSTQIFQSEIAAALNDPLVHSILLLVDSPGGQVDGTQAAADTVRNVRGKKPIYALADGQMASAAYWIGSAADQIFMASDTTMLGSIGVLIKHFDYSKANEAQGVKVSEITAGKYKNLASENAPLSDAGRASLQDIADHMYSVFVNSVAANRNVPVRQVLSKMAEGRVFLGQQAIDAGLADGFSTVPELIDELKSKSQGKSAPKTQKENVMTTQNKTIVGRDASARASDTNELAARISAYVRKEVAAGRRCTYAQAAAQVEMQMGGNSGDAQRMTVSDKGGKAAVIRNAQSLAQRMQAYMDEQRALGNRVSYVEALHYVENH